MINVIVSHDVDHLFGRDHWFRDLVYPKLWVRTSMQLIKGEVRINEWILRNSSCFKKERHRIDELMKFDKQHGVKSTFFFGMNQGLGMSYKPDEAVKIIHKVHENGFGIGVHGIDYQTRSGMQKEYDTFTRTVGFIPDGIRMHYVRYDGDTFRKLESVGYMFDSTEFDKENCGTRKKPYKLGELWEFPLTIMDVYLPKSLEAAKQETIKILEECRTKKIDYISVLFHDYQFYDGYKDIRDWYIWLIEYFDNSEEFQFISYSEAIEHLENGRNMQL